MSAYERLAVEAAPGVTVTALRVAVRERGMIEYVVIDHGRDMSMTGSVGHVAWTLVFGNPAAGVRVLARDPAAAVDLPLRLAVIEAEPGRCEIVLRDMRSLLADDLAKLADGLTTVLREVATEARTLAEGG